LTPHFVIELRRDARLDQMRVIAEARPGHAEATSRAALASLLDAHLRGALGLGVEVLVGEPGTVERSAGKARRIIDLRPKR
jgi:phenylacetate-CoA ligase